MIQNLKFQIEPKVMIVIHDLVFVQVIFFHLLSYNFFVQGYTTRDLVKQELKVGELVIFFANNLMEFFLGVF